MTRYYHLVTRRTNIPNGIINYIITQGYKGTSAILELLDTIIVPPRIWSFCNYPFVDDSLYFKSFKSFQSHILIGSITEIVLIPPFSDLFSSTVLFPFHDILLLPAESLSKSHRECCLLSTLARCFHRHFSTHSTFKKILQTPSYFHNTPTHFHLHISNRSLVVL